MAFQNLDVVDATKAGPAALLNLATAGVAWDDTTYTHGLEFANDGKTFLFVYNGAAALVTMQWIPVDDPDGRQSPDDILDLDVLNVQQGLMGPYLPRIWNSALGRIQVLPSNNDALIKYVAIRIANPT